MGQLVSAHVLLPPVAPGALDNRASTGISRASRSEETPNHRLQWRGRRCQSIHSFLPKNGLGEGEISQQELQVQEQEKCCACRGTSV
eukprot:COSAG03_NODE_13001_length_522_cov_0.789598_1_plen_86_part_10